ncbi:lysophospholipase [Gracilibacillus halophilus YIM-C55.5]|uniref:Lysophospholipase n=1 Tax=Gracilibacillus halophilus YIM-C55.5 TaxID=1308866 RepID=N4WPX7_9BACI|nr:rhamnogalacturonan acetylesterase [Gracilibacillus halophilus]ENH96505.1 lysophospholipase [Gracilibacillus halophilus YIM-C55.5]
MKKVQLFLAGDSTMCDYEPERYPRMGWGQVLSSFFHHQVMIRNHAASGRSSRSFLTEKRWEAIEKELQAGDYVLIQFGHNDQKPDLERSTDPFSSYQEHLQFMIERTRTCGGTPLLLTSIARRHFSETGKLLDTHGDYPKAACELAEKQGVTVIDMNRLSQRLISELGEESSKKLFMWIAPGIYSAYPDGEQDDTHLQEHGARAMARLFIDEIQEIKHPLATFLPRDEVKS